MDITELCTAIRAMKPSPDECEALLITIANNLGFIDDKSETAIDVAADVVGSFIGNRDALGYEKRAERDAKGPI